MSRQEEYIPDELNLFADRAVQLSITGTTTHSYAPINSLDNTQCLEFVSPALNDQFKDLSSCCLRLTLQILKRDGTKYAAGDTAQPKLASNIIGSMFKAAQVSINNILVRNIDSNYGIKELLETKLNYDRNSLKTRLASTMYYDEGGETAFTDQIKNSQEFEVYGRLNLLNLDRYLLPMCSLNIKLHLANSDIFLLENSVTANDATTTSDSKLVIMQAHLLVNHKTVRENVFYSIEKILSSGRSAVYDHTSGNVLTYNIPSGASQISVQSLYSGPKPRLAILGFMTNSLFTGNKKDSWKFVNPNIKRFNFVVNGTSSPMTPAVFDTENGKYAHLYSSLYEELGFNNSKRSNLILCKEFAKNDFLLALDLTNSKMALDSISELPEHCILGINAELKSSLDSAYTIILYLLFDFRFEITATRTVNLIT